MNVGEILKLDPLRLITARAETPVDEAARRMAKYRVGIVVVLHDDETVAGILSERDIVSGLGQIMSDTGVPTVGALMTEGVVAITPKGSLVDAVLAMNDHGIRHLVVVDDKKPVGVLSIRDVLRVFATMILDEEGDTDRQVTEKIAKLLAAA